MTTSTAVAAQSVLDVIHAQRYQYAREADLQDALMATLTGAFGKQAHREVRLTARDRIDFLVGRIGVEVKVASDAIAVMRQLQRYAGSDRVDSLILVTTRARHGIILPDTIGGKPLRTAVVGAWL